MIKHYYSLTRAFVVLTAAIQMVAARKPAQFYLKFQIAAESRDYYYVRTRTDYDNPRDDERHILFATKSETDKYTLAYFYHEDFKLKHKPGNEEIGTDNILRLSLNPATSIDFDKRWNDQAKENWIGLRFTAGASFYTCATDDLDKKMVALLKPTDFYDTKLQSCVAFDHFVVVNV